MKKVITFGPWAAALFQIVEKTQKKRKDLEVKRFSKNCKFYRGGGLTLEEIIDFKDN